jgi:hypothetical protein
MLARMSRDARTLSGVVACLETASIVTWVFGGWAEEMQGLGAQLGSLLETPRGHCDRIVSHAA